MCIPIDLISTTDDKLYKHLQLPLLISSPPKNLSYVDTQISKSPPPTISFLHRFFSAAMSAAAKVKAQRIIDENAVGMFSIERSDVMKGLDTDSSAW